MEKLENVIDTKGLEAYHDELMHKLDDVFMEKDELADIVDGAVVFKTDELYQRKDNVIYPLAHPDLSTQPSVLPQRFGNLDIKEVLIANGREDEIPLNVIVIGAWSFNSEACVPAIVRKNAKVVQIDGSGAKDVTIKGWSISNIAGIVPDFTLVRYVGEENDYYYASGGEESGGDELFVDLGLPSGRLWATRNIDVTQENGFAASPFQYECSFFSWGNTDGHNPVSARAFEDNFFNQSTYNSSDGANIQYPNTVPLENDIARVRCGEPWRLPTAEEFQELYDYCDVIDMKGEKADGATLVNDVFGLLLRSKVNGKTIFFPCSGEGDASLWFYHGLVGFYWLSSLDSQESGLLFSFSSGGVAPQSAQGRYDGLAGRPVQ